MSSRRRLEPEGESAFRRIDRERFVYFSRMFPARIADLLEPFIAPAVLSQDQLLKISSYIDILLKWNARTNLTSIRDEEGIVTRHFGESFFAARYLLADAPPGLRVFDVGSGAGFPGLPFKLYAPQIAITLIESHNKKAIFLREVIRALPLQQATVISARAELILDTADLVTLRAVEKFESILPIAARLVAPTGRLALLVGERQVETAQSIVAGTWSSSEPIPHSTGRVVAVWQNRLE
jgi:16S rRNA (guanine527-N7)-methyltransferase